MSSLARAHASQNSMQSDESFGSDVEEAFLRHWITEDADMGGEDGGDANGGSGGGEAGGGGGGVSKPALVKEVLITFYLRSVAVSFNKEVSTGPCNSIHSSKFKFHLILFDFGQTYNLYLVSASFS